MHIIAPDLKCDACGSLYGTDKKRAGDWCNCCLGTFECDGMVRSIRDWYGVPLWTYELHSAEYWGKHDGPLLADTQIKDYLLRMLAEIRRFREAAEMKRRIQTIQK